MCSEVSLSGMALKFQPGVPAWAAAQGWNAPELGICLCWPPRGSCQPQGHPGHGPASSLSMLSPNSTGSFSLPKPHPTTQPACDWSHGAALDPWTSEGFPAASCTWHSSPALRFGKPSQFSTQLSVHVSPERLSRCHRTVAKVSLKPPHTTHALPAFPKGNPAPFVLGSPCWLLQITFGKSKSSRNGKEASKMVSRRFCCVIFPGIKVKMSRCCSADPPSSGLGKWVQDLPFCSHQEALPWPFQGDRELSHCTSGVPVSSKSCSCTCHVQFHWTGHSSQCWAWLGWS